MRDGTFFKTMLFIREGISFIKALMGKLSQLQKNYYGF